MIIPIRFNSLFSFALLCTCLFAGNLQAAETVSREDALAALESGDFDVALERFLGVVENNPEDIE